MIRLMLSDCRATLPTLEPESVQACITSPPYYGLRDYGLPPLVWGENERGLLFGKQHEHEWGMPDVRTFTAPPGTAKQASNVGALAVIGTSHFCPCGAWLGSLGLEPTPELYIEHIVECFRAVRRVLREDATVWLNLGDSYAGSGKGPSNSLNKGNPHSHEAALAMGTRNTAQYANGQAPTQWIPVGKGYKPKDLMMMPARVAMALQADGWYLRSMIPWLKRNSMPESVADRPATAVEYVFLLSKSSRYFWDADAVRVKTGCEASAEDYAAARGNGPFRNSSLEQYGLRRGNTRPALTHPNGRSRRNSDWFFESWQGLLLDEQDEALALVVNPRPWKEAHFATFPTTLVEPMIKASTSERGACPSCGAPWRRVVERTSMVTRPSERMETVRNMDQSLYHARTAIHGTMVEPPTAVTTGWQPPCHCAPAEPVPQVVLDPFGGSGTVGLVADRLGRDAVLCELKPDYSQMGRSRIVEDAPLFTTLEMFA